MRIAIATTDGKTISGHFGQSPEFSIIDIDETSWTWKISEQRMNAGVKRVQGHDANAFEKTVELVKDCETVIVSQVGPRAKMILDRNGIQVLETEGLIDEVLEKYISYLKKKRVPGRAV
jgi:predicted Fe-Mo cluster-binding NifX family protein